jgi:hypothetical protein
MTLARETHAEAGGRVLRLGAALLLGAMLSSCGLIEGSRLYHGPDSVIANTQDAGTDTGTLIDGEAAIAYDPDGCQVWIIDDGLEGYSSPRYDPKTGLPICDGKYPPGTVLGDYQSSSSPIADRVPE